MADISKIKLPDNSEYDIKDATARSGIGNAKMFYGTCSSAAGDTTKVVDCPIFTSADLTVGVIIIVKFDTTNSGAVGSIKLDVNGTGAKNIKYMYNGSVSNIASAAYIKSGTAYHFYYDGNYWIVQMAYNTNDASNGYSRFSHGTYTTTTAVGRYVICLTKSLTSVVPVTAVNNSTATSKALTTDKFNPFEPIFYYTNNGSTTQTAANSVLTISYLWRTYSNINLGYSFNTGSTLTNNKDVFIKASPTDGYMATLASTPIVQDLPTSDDGYIYIKLGHACSTSNIAMSYEHPIYWYKDGKVRPYGRWELASTSAYGATKLSSATNSTSTALAATPSAVKTAYDEAVAAKGIANEAKSGVDGTLIYDHDYTISNGVATFTPHVYCKGAEVTTNYNKSCFTWKYRLSTDVTTTPTYVTLTTNDNRGCTVNIASLGYGGHVIGIFTPPT